MHLRRPLRLAATVAAAALLATGLAGCDQIFQPCSPKASAGDASDSVTAGGRFGSEPTVHFP
ncbi:MAG: hypothetical protein QOC59_1312, partial [Microbacteriaceae bacterium]|nr:hypothetical protein [Microbacteriaceae bacterium]